MRFDPHDLIRLRGPSALVGDLHNVTRVRAILARNPWAVVRRGLIRDGLVPITVPGNGIGGNLTAHVTFRDVEQRCTPEGLHGRIYGIGADRMEAVPAFAALPRLSSILYGYSWGPIGSLAFELASGQPVADHTGMIDIVVRRRHAISPGQALELHLAIARAAFPVRANVILELPRGGVCLADIATMAAHVLVYTVHGPQIVAKQSLLG